MSDIVTDLSIKKNWNVAVGFNNTFTFTFTLSGAFNISGYTFSLQIRKFNAPSTNIVNLTQASGLSNGGATGILTAVLTAAQSATLTDGEYFWQLMVVHPDTYSYRWFNGTIRASKELYSGDTASGTSDTISLNGSNVSVSINVPGISPFRGNYDPSGGTFPSTGGNGTGGAPAFGDFWQTTVDGTIAGLTVPAGSHLWARQNNPDDDWSLTGWKLI